MNSKAATALLVTLGSVVPVAYGTSIPAGGPDMPVRFRLRQSYKVIVPVSVNGLKPVSFILDTGTKTTMIDVRIRRRLNLPPIARMPLTTFTGSLVVDIIRLDTLALGGASISGPEVSSLDLCKVFSIDSDIHGILGQDFLRQFNYLLDYRAQRILLEEGDNLEQEMRGVHIPIEQRDYRDHVHYDPADESEAAVHFMLDSGSRFPVIFQNPRVDSTLQISRDNTVLCVAGPLGSRDVESGRIRTLRVGQASFRNLPVRLSYSRPIERRWENGLLPTCLLDAVYFNHAKGYIVANPDFSR